jgi:hypothetical protein
MLISAAVAITGLKLRPERLKVRLPQRSACQASTSAISPRSACSRIIGRPLMLRASLPSALLVPTPVGVKNAPTPAPAARMRSASVPWGTISSSILPARYNSSNTVEVALRGNEQMILRTRPASISPASPPLPPPALLATTTRSFTPVSISASTRALGWPTAPKPPSSTVMPSRTPFSASAMVGTILLIMRGLPRGC